MFTQPARTLRDVFQVTDPSEPLMSGDPRYVDCADVRGDLDVVSFLFNRLTWQREGAFSHQLFSGHRGCGKSTELLRLKARLISAGYAVFYFEVSDYVDLADVSYSDIILSIVRRVTADLAQQRIDLDDRLLTAVTDWFAETLYTKEQWREVQRSLEAEAAAGVDTTGQLPLVVRLLARVVGQIRSGDQIKHTIRQQLDPQITQLIQHTNALLKSAQHKLNQPLVIIVDNLDRIRLEQISAERTNYDAIYIDHAQQLCDLQAHMIYTIPISMIYSVNATQLKSYFPNPAVLPMVKGRNRDGSPNPLGLDKLRQILAQRIVIDEIYTAEAVDYLCLMCGGHPRDLMLLAHTSTQFARQRWPRPLDLNSVQRAFGMLVTDYSRAIPDEHYPLLARIHQTKEKSSNDVANNRMLYNQSVLEYLNGDPPWYDIHPAVLALPRMQAALADARQKMGLESSR